MCCLGSPSAASYQAIAWLESAQTAEQWCPSSSPSLPCFAAASPLPAGGQGTAVAYAVAGQSAAGVGQPIAAVGQPCAAGPRCLADGQSAAAGSSSADAAGQTADSAQADSAHAAAPAKQPCVEGAVEGAAVDA